MEKDPVCGMLVDPSKAAQKVSYEGNTFYFCHASCATKFSLNPAFYLNPPALKIKRKDSFKKGMRFYCPMDPEIIRDAPDSCPKCGMELEPLGFQNVQNHSKERGRELYKIIICILLWLPLFSFHLANIHPHGPLLAVQGVISAIIVFGFGWQILRNFVYSIKKLNFNMFTLVGLGILSSEIISLVSLLTEKGPNYFEAASGIVVLMMIGTFLEGNLHRKVNLSLLKLISSQNTLVRVRGPGGAEHEMPLELVQIGDELLIQPSQQVPLDGVVISGFSTLDCSSITGESIPEDIGPGDKILSGSINCTGLIILQATSTGDESTITKILRKVEEAQTSRMPIQNLVDKIAKWVVPTVLLISTLTFLAWIFSNEENALEYALNNAISVLVIACPCALGLATPMAIAVGAAKAAHLGILVSRGEDFQRLHLADTLVVDKTGTLTEGKPRIKSITNLTSFEESAFLKKITPVAQGSSHPLSKAIYQESIRRNIQIATATGIIEKPGEGLQGEVDGIKIILGKKDFVFSKVHSNPKIQYLELDTASPRIFIGFNEKLAGWIEFEDRIRQSSPSAMSEIRKMGLDIILLTGDQANVAQKVATELKITNYHGNLSPLGKASFIKELISKGKTVAMAGDGTNDAPGLSTAQIGISMGTGTDLAKESAGLVILNSDLQSIQKAIYLSKFTMNAIRQNLILAFAYNLLCIPVAAFGFLNPLIAGIAMTISSLSVLANSLRLLWHRV